MGYFRIHALSLPATVNELKQFVAELDDDPEVEDTGTLFLRTNAFGIPTSVALGVEL